MTIPTNIPAPQSKRPETWVIVVVVIVVVCCCCFGAIGMLLAFGGPLLNELGLISMLLMAIA